MVVVLCVMSGFESALKKRLFDSQVHVLVLPQEAGFLDSATLSSDLQKWAVFPGVKSVEPVLQTEVVVKEVQRKLKTNAPSFSAQRISGALLKGVSPAHWARLSRNLNADEKISEGQEMGGNHLLIGQELSFELGVTAGDQVILVSPLESEASDTPLGAVPQVKTFFIEGVYNADGAEQESQEIFAPVNAVESFLRKKEIFSQVELRVEHPDDAIRVADVLKRDLASTYRVKSWSELNSHLFWSLKLERMAMICVLVFLILVASFSIVTTLSISIAEKGRSLGIMRALGATQKQIRNIVLWQGMGIGLVGILGGGGLGLVTCLVLQKTNFIEMPDVYYDKTLPVEIRPSVFLLVIVAVFFVVLFSSMLPLRQIKKVSAMATIRAQR